MEMLWKSFEPTEWMKHYMTVLALFVVTVYALHQITKHLSSRQMKPFWRLLFRFSHWVTAIWERRDRLMASIPKSSGKPGRYFFVAWTFITAAGFGIWLGVAAVLAIALLLLGTEPDFVRVIALTAFMILLAECTRLFFIAGRTELKRLGYLR